MMSHNIFSNHAQFFLIDDCEFLLAERISIEAQIRTIEIALRMTMAEKVKLHELRRFIYIYIYIEHLGLFIKYNDEVNLNVNGGGWGDFFFP